MTINDHDIQGMPIRLLFVRYLMASFLYYQLDESSPWSDHEYDAACKRLYDEWDTFEHPHKVFADRECLTAGSGYQIRYYPKITQSSALSWARGKT